MKCTPQQFSQIQQRLERETRLKLTQFLLINLYRDTHWITRHLIQRRATNSQTNFKNSIEFTYSYFPCHLKVNRDKLVSINRLWKCKKSERLAITANSLTKINQLDGFRTL